MLSKMSSYILSIVFSEKSEIESFLITAEDNCFEICIFVEKISHLIRNHQNFDIVIIEILSAEELKIEFSSVTTEHNHFEECIFIEKSSEISDSEMKINLIVKFSRLMSTFFCSIFRAFFIITK